MSTREKKIFIVDDSPAQNEKMKDALEKQGEHKIFICNTGEACLELMEEVRPDVVVLDFYLNSVHKDAANGLDILKKIKQHDPHIHVIMLSSQDSYAKALETIQKGAESYVVKDGKAFERIADIVHSIQV